jgi:hypothetical protein
MNVTTLIDAQDYPSGSLPVGTAGHTGGEKGALIFGEVQREELRSAIRTRLSSRSLDQVYNDETRAAEAARALTRACINNLCLPPREARRWSGGILSKLCGYNAQLHAWAIRLLGAVESVDTLLTNVRSLTFTCSDLLLGEYFLLERAHTRGVKVTTSTPMDELMAGLTAAWPPHCDAQGYQTTECVLDELCHVGEMIDGAAPWAPTRIAVGHGVVEDTTPIDVLFVATMETYVSTMMPVARELAARGQKPAFLLPRAWRTWGAARELMLHAVVEIERVEDCPQPREVIQPPGLGGCVSDDLLMLEGIRLAPLAGRDVDVTLRSYVPYLSGVERRVRSLLTRRHVGAVVVARLRRATEHVVVSVAGEVNIPCTLLVHGHISDRPEREFVDGDFAPVSKVLVWGEAQAQVVQRKLTRAGATGECPRIVVTGNPCWDAAGCAAEPTGPAVLTYIGQPDGFAHVEPLVHAVARAQSAAPILLRLRPHPGESLAHYEILLESGEFGNKYITLSDPRSVPLEDDLRSATAVLTFHSTANLEALAWGVPVVTLAMDERAQHDRFVRLEEYGLPIIHDAAALYECVRTIAAHPRAWREEQASAVARAQSAWRMSRDAARVCADEILRSGLKVR